MFNEFEIWVLPHNLRVASERAAKLLGSADFNTLYLHVPREFSWLIEDLALGAPYEQFIKEVKRLNVLRESIDSWEYRVKPILSAIRGLKLRRPGLKIICYRSVSFENSSTKNAEEVAMLVLRVNITGKVDVEEWLEVLCRTTSKATKLIDEENNYILRTWFEDSGEKKAICVSDYMAKDLLKRMRENGVKASLRCIFTPYYFTPLEVLMHEIAKSANRRNSIDHERVKKLIFMHVEFIRKYVLTSSSYDEAYFRWVRDECYKLY